MKIANILEENNMLYEQHALNYQATIANTCIGLNALQKTITVGVFTDLLPAVKSSVITPSVNELTENKLLLNIPSLVESINTTLNYADRWKNTPAKVDNFDYRFNVLENEIFAKLGESSAIKTHLDKLYEYATYNHKHDALILGLLSATASIENGSVGHTIAEQLLTSYIPISSEYAVEHVQPQYVPSRPLSEGRIYLLIDNVCKHNESMVSESVLVNVTESTNFSGRRYTTLVTSDQLRSAWMEAGQPQDAGQVAVLLSECGINSRVIYNTCNDMQIYLNESALQALNEGPFGNFLAKGAAAVGKGIGAVAGGLRGMATPIKTGYAAGRAAVEKYGAPDSGQAAAPAQAAPAPDSGQAPAQAAPAPDSGQAAAPAQAAPAQAAPAGKAKPATNNRAFSAISTSVTGMDLASKKKLLASLQQQVQQAPAAEQEAPAPSKAPAAPAKQAQLPAPTQQAQLPAPGKAQAAPAAPAKQAQLPAPANNGGWDVMDAPAKPLKQQPPKYNNADAMDVEVKPVNQAKQAQLPAPTQQAQLPAPGKAQAAPAKQAQLPAPTQQAPAKQAPAPAAPAKKQPPPRTPKATGTTKRKMPAIPSNEALYRSIKNELLESYKAYKKMR